MRGAIDGIPGLGNDTGNSRGYGMLGVASTLLDLFFRPTLLGEPSKDRGAIIHTGSIFSFLNSLPLEPDCYSEGLEGTLQWVFHLSKPAGQQIAALGRVGRVLSANRSISCWLGWPPGMALALGLPGNFSI